MGLRKLHVSVMLTRERRKILEHLKAYDSVHSSTRIEEELERTGAWDRWERELQEAQLRYADRE